jgi:putative Ca2+/H+ antiporter (TMEM165/GDT1 family)
VTHLRPAVEAQDGRQVAGSVRSHPYRLLRMSSFFAALGIVFLAELGDKTQLVALGFGARYRLSTVLAGVAAGYMASMLLSVVIGGLLGAALPTNAISIGGGLLFVAFAVVSLRAARRAGDAPGDEDGDALGELGLDPGPEIAPDGAVPRDTRVVLSIAAAMFVAELGDKTMLATATLAAQGNPVLVWFGATVGIMLAGTVGVVIGRWLGDRLPERVIMIGSSLLFLIFGIALIVSGVLGAT